MMTKTITGFLVLSATAWAQQFEVATIKPGEQIIVGTGQRVNAGVTVDGVQFRSSMLSLRDYLGIAFSARLYQIEGPEWLASERFDINAKMPAAQEGKALNSTDLALMMRALLEERFQLKTHRTQKEFPVFALVQLKDGIKAVEAPLDATDGRSSTVGGSGTAQGTVISMGRGSTLSVGGNKIEGRKFSMSVLADILARFVDKPVVDQTGLIATYDISLELTPEDFQALSIRSSIAAGVTLPPQAMKLLETASGDSLHEALAKVGLKLEQKKVPLEVIVVDSINRKPTDN